MTTLRSQNQSSTLKVWMSQILSGWSVSGSHGEKFPRHFCYRGRETRTCLSPHIGGWQICLLVACDRTAVMLSSTEASSELSWFNDKYIKQFAVRTIHAQSVLSEPLWMLSLENKYTTFGGFQVKALLSDTSSAVVNWMQTFVYFRNWNISDFCPS